ncbi:MAG: acetate--CoA ligase [Elusimicrobia bacterium]|nr:MAG: acetate--CoA ligase [Elusimicrobiota bacterium]
MATDTIETNLKENRVFKPSREFARQAHVKSAAQREALSKNAARRPEKYWEKQAAELKWQKKWKKTLEWKPPLAKWFVGGQLNVSENCLDRHLTGPRRNKAAIIWEGEPGDTRTLTYHQLHRETCRFANALKNLGVRKGDRVILYMPLVPEAAIAMLACTRIGAVHSVVFGGFSSQSLRDRIQDTKAKIVITSDGGYRKGKAFGLKQQVDDAVEECASVKKVVVVKRTDQTVGWHPQRDVWWHDAVEGQSAENIPIPLDAEHPLFVLYTSGSTGKPKGILHTTGGYLTVAASTARQVFDLKEDDVYWCTADVGWITGHTYVVYGPLANGATTFLYEGAPMHPGPDRFWSLIAKYGITIFYTAPTAIRAFMRLGDSHPQKHDLSSLRLLGTVGEPINPKAWSWYHTVIGGGRCPIVDTYWQTETGGIMISPLPGATPTKPGSATLAMPGIDAAVVDKNGKEVPNGKGGFLVIRKPWPSMLRTVYGDPERYKKQYFSEFGPKLYFTGDGARRDKDGYFWLLGRVDDVINVSGHRLSTMEVESALVAHPQVAEAAVVSIPHEIKGEGIAAFVTLRRGTEPVAATTKELEKAVVKAIGAIARPDKIRFTDALPKTRSGKIMRRLLRSVASGEAVSGDTTTLEDFSALTKLQEED